VKLLALKQMGHAYAFLLHLVDCVIEEQNHDHKRYCSASKNLNSRHWLCNCLYDWIGNKNMKYNGTYTTASSAASVVFQIALMLDSEQQSHFCISVIFEFFYETDIMPGI
jgi:hypothetical protein